MNNVKETGSLLISRTHKKAAHKIKDVNSQFRCFAYFCWRIFFSSNLFFLFSFLLVCRHLDLFIHFSLPIFRGRTNVDLHWLQPNAHLLFKKTRSKKHTRKSVESKSSWNERRETMRFGRWMLLFSVEKRIYSNHNNNNYSYNTTSWNQNRKMRTHIHTHVKLILMTLL